MRVEVLDRDGRPIGPYSIDACNPVRTDSTRARVTWTSAADLGAVSGEIVRFRFHLSSARLYAFWVSASPTGASHGFAAGGGPGLRGIADAG